MMATQWRGLNQLDDMIRALKELPQKLGEEIETTVKQRTPVQTGKLQNSIEKKVENGRVVVGTDVDYAPYVEFGTADQQPAGMFGTTFVEVPNMINDLLKR